MAFEYGLEGDKGVESCMRQQMPSYSTVVTETCAILLKLIVQDLGQARPRRALVRLDLALQPSPLRFGIHFRVMTVRLPEMPLPFLSLSGNGSGLRAVLSVPGAPCAYSLAAAAAGESAAEASCPCPCEGMLS